MYLPSGNYEVRAGYMSSSNGIRKYGTGEFPFTLGATDYVKFDAGTTDHTASNVILIDLDVESASMSAIEMDIDVSSALSASEAVYGLKIDIDGHGSDNATAVLSALYLNTSGTSTGKTYGIWFQGTSFDYHIGLDDDLKIFFDTNDGSTELGLYDSDGVKVLSFNSDGEIVGPGTAAGITSSGNITLTLGDPSGSYSFIIRDSTPANIFTMNSDADTVWLLPADSYILIDADTTDHTTNDVFQINLDVNSASLSAISLDIDVTTALSASETVYGISINIDGHGSDDATSKLAGIYLTTAGTSTGKTYGIWFAGTAFDYHIGLDDDLNVIFDTNDGSTELALYDSDGTKKFYVDSDGIIGSDLGYVEIETLSDVGSAALVIDQNDTDEPFIEYEGNIQSDSSANISTQNGDGSVDGPNNYSSSAGWTFYGMIRVGINGTDRWMPLYDEDTS